jgi:hypothetical protein
VGVVCKQLCTGILAKGEHFPSRYSASQLGQLAELALSYYHITVAPLLSILTTMFLGTCSARF